MLLRIAKSGGDESVGKAVSIDIVIVINYQLYLPNSNHLY